MTELNYKNYLNLTDNLLVVIDETGTIIDTNNAFDTFIVKNNSFFDLIKTTELDAFKKALSNIKGSETIQIETIINDTKIIWNVLKDTQASLYYMSGKQAADTNYAYEQLQHLEEKSRIQLKSMPTPSYTWRRVENDFVLSDFSDIVFHETEGKVQHLIGISSKKLFSHNPEILEDMEKCFTQKVTIIKDTKYFVHETEEYRYYNMRYAYVPTDTIIIQIEDTTDKKLMELEIKEKEEKYRSLFFNTTYSVLLVNNEGLILEYNESSLKMFGYTEEELSKVSIIDIIKMPDKAYDDNIISQIEEFILELFNMSIVDGFVEIVCMKKNKETFPAEVQTHFIKIKNNNVLLLFIRDITERKNHEMELEKYIGFQEKANHELKIYNYIIAHDLKAPLRAMNNIIEWLGEDYADKFDEEGNKLLALLKNRATRMHDLIDSILRYSKIGKSEVVFEETYLHELIKSTINLLHVPKHIKINSINYDIRIKTPVIYLQQIFQNLLSNSIKFMDKPKGIINIGFEEMESEYKFWVQDNGKGIEKQYFDKIFALFQTLQPKDEYESTGIGLSIVKKIIETYDGKLWLESEIGKGTTFYFTLPKGVKNE